MIVNADFVRAIKDKSLTYSEALALSKSKGLGEIPFGEYCLAVGIAKYAADFDVPVELCVRKIRGYADPKDFVSTGASTDLQASQPVVSSHRCCGGGKVR